MVVDAVPAAIEVHVELAAETLFHIGPIPITNAMLTMFIVMGFLLLVGSLLARRAQVVPGRGQAAFELIVEFLLNLVESTGGRRLGRRIFPLIATLFIFIIVANYSGLLPGVGTIGYCEEVIPAEGEHAETSSACEGKAEEAEHDEPEAAVAFTTLALQEQSEGDEPADAESTGGAAEHEEGEGVAEEAHAVWVLRPFFRAPNADLNMTLAMALITFTTVQVLGIRMNGIGGRLKHMADPWFMFPIEVISELSRIISLSFRLFGNVFAGEVLLALMVAMANAIKIALVPLLLPVIFLFLETLFGFIQALVFALLTLIYIALAAAGHGDGEHEHEHEPGHGAAPAGGHAPGHAAAGTGD
jgi:F-type H+-transporting ATPase subunit a